jgi:hypothetical protein
MPGILRTGCENISPPATLKSRLGQSRGSAEPQSRSEPLKRERWDLTASMEQWAARLCYLRLGVTDAVSAASRADRR